MSLADQIREFVEKKYITPARKSGRPTVTINTGDVHREMNLRNRFPAVCEAMRSQKFSRTCGVTLTSWDGPTQGASVNVTYSFSGEADSPVPRVNAKTAPLMTIDWSPEIPLDSKDISKSVPHQPGIYKLLQNSEYSRYVGSTRVLKIGLSKTSLQKEILNHLNIHTAANRLARIIQSGTTVSVAFAVLAVETAREAESRLLREFEDQHWDVPTLNSQRGYARGQDSHYRKKSQHAP